MNVIEKKSTLAKLLAKENITVTHGNMKTTSTLRIVGAAMWKDRGRDVYDMLIGTKLVDLCPLTLLKRFVESGWSAFDVCNVVEDIRIERLIKGAGLVTCLTLLPSLLKQLLRNR